MNFANPWMLLLLLPVAVAAWRLLRRGRRSGIRFSAVLRLPPRSAGWRARVAAMTPYLMLSGLVMLVVAMARPRTPMARERRSVDAIAIVMAVDVSGSMDALDFTPMSVLRSGNVNSFVTRLAQVKRVFASFVEKRPDDLIGLVTFGGYAATRTPLTADRDALLNVLRGVKTATIDFDADGNVMFGDERQTAIGDGLAMALARLEDAPTKSKIVILLSDGDQTVADAVEPKDAAEAAATKGVKVYAIGVGTRSRSAYFLGKDAFGRASLTQQPTGFDEKQLREIAKITGGTYFAVNDTSSLEAALKEIDQLETTKLDADVYDRWNEHFVTLLLAGVILVCCAVTLSMAASRRMA